MERLHLRIYGMVQGVFFRANAQQIAAGLGLTGWVQNRRDGSVEIVAEGKKEKLDTFLAWCRRGPDSARVDRVEPAWLRATGEFPIFRITYEV